MKVKFTSDSVVFKASESLLFSFTFDGVNVFQTKSSTLFNLKVVTATKLLNRLRDDVMSSL